MIAVLSALILVGSTALVITLFTRDTQLGGDASAFNGTTNLNIATETDFNTFRSMVNSGTNFSGKTITQTANITLDDNSAVIPIGKSSSYPFRGTYDGGGYTISLPDFFDSSSNYQYFGVFGYIYGATITNTHVFFSPILSSSSTSYSTIYCGGIVGYAYCSSSSYRCTITKCSTRGYGIELYSLPNTTCYMGGILGYASNSSYCTVTDCVSDFGFHASDVQNVYSAGVAYNANVSRCVLNSRSSDISANGTGYFYGITNLNAYNCGITSTNSMSVTSGGSSASSARAYVICGGTAYSCYALSSVRAEYNYGASNSSYAYVADSLSGCNYYCKLNGVQNGSLTDKTKLYSESGMNSLSWNSSYRWDFNNYWVFTNYSHEDYTSGYWYKIPISTAGNDDFAMPKLICHEFYPIIYIDTILLYQESVIGNNTVRTAENLGWSRGPSYELKGYSYTSNDGPVNVLPGGTINISNRGVKLYVVWGLKSFDITATVNNRNYGTVTGAGEYEINTTCKLEAKPYTGYQFVRWQNSDGSTYSTSASISFTVTADRSFTAVFEIAQYTVSASVNDSSMGEVTGDGLYTYGSSCTLTATPYDGYRFVQWLLNGSNYGSSNVIVLNPITQNYSFTAVFERDTCVVTLAGDISSDFYTSNLQPNYQIGSTVNLTIDSLDNRFKFVGWYDTNGSLLCSTNDYSFVVNTDTTLVPKFEFLYDSYEIDHISLLYWLSERVAQGFDFAGVEFFITSDLSFDSVSDPWTSIGANGKDFAGIVHGSSYVISKSSGDTVTVFDSNVSALLYDIQVSGLVSLGKPLQSNSDVVG